LSLGLVNALAGEVEVTRVSLNPDEGTSKVRSRYASST
jgi:hypothetical protein